MSRKLSRRDFGAVLICAAMIGPAAAGEEPVIVSRTEWKAKPAGFKMKAQTPKRILIHHTGSKSHLGASILKKMASLQHFSQSKQKLSDGRTKLAWADVPYHFYIAADGAIAEGREITSVGDTNTNYDPSGYIQVVLEGNFEIEEPSAVQLAALEKLTVWLMKQYKISATEINFHRGVAQTACPGKNLIDKLPGVIKALGGS